MISQLVSYIANAPVHKWYCGIAFTNPNSQDVFPILTYRSGATGKIIRSDAIVLPAHTIRIFQAPTTEICSLLVETELPILIEVHLREGEPPKWYDRRLATQVEFSSVHPVNSNTLVSWPVEALPYVIFTGNCRMIQERHLSALLSICRKFFLKYGWKILVMDLNQIGGCPNHPIGTHTGKNGDFGYLANRNQDTEFWKYLFEVFPESSIQTHTIIFEEVRDIVGETDRAFLQRISHDESPKYGHMGHFHFNFGGLVNWSAL